MKRILIGWMAVLLICGCGTPPKTETTKSSGGQEVAVLSDEDYVQEGIEHLQDAEVTEAIKSFDQAIKQDPLEPEPYLVLSQTYMRLKQYDRAIDTLEAAERVAPNRGDIQYLLAINYGITGQEDMAKQSAKKSIELFRQDQDEENFMKAVALLQGMLKNQK